MRQALGYIFAALSLAALLFNSYLVYRYCIRGRGSSPVALFVAMLGTLAAICFKGSSLGGNSYLAIFAVIFLFSMLTSLPITYYCYKRGILKGPSIFGSRNKGEEE